MNKKKDIQYYYFIVVLVLFVVTGYFSRGSNIGNGTIYVLYYIYILPVSIGLIVYLYVKRTEVLSDLRIDISLFGKIRNLFFWCFIALFYSIFTIGIFMFVNFNIWNSYYIRKSSVEFYNCEILKVSVRTRGNYVDFVFDNKETRVRGYSDKTKAIITDTKYKQKYHIKIEVRKALFDTYKVLSWEIKDSSIIGSHRVN